MSRTLKTIAGSGGGGAFVAGDKFKLTPHVTPLKDDLDLLMLGLVARAVYAGGDWDNGVDASAAGDFDVLRAVPFEVDNASNQISGSTGLVCRITYYCRVSNAAITITPKIVYGTAITNLTNVATISGHAACSAIAADYSGTNQVQQVTFTLPSGVKLFKPRFTVAGTPAAGYQAYVFATRDLYVA